MKIKEAIIWLAILAVLTSVTVSTGHLAAVMGVALVCSALVIRLVAAVALMDSGGVGGPPRARPKCKPRPGKTIRIVPNIIDPPHDCGSSQRIPIRPFLVASTQEMEDAISVGLDNSDLNRLLKMATRQQTTTDTYPDW